MDPKVEVDVTKKLTIRGAVKTMTVMATSDDGAFALDDDGRYMWTVSEAIGSVVINGEPVASEIFTGDNAVDEARAFVSGWFADKGL